MSMDHRVMSVADRCPLVGDVAAISEEYVKVRSQGRDTLLSIDPDTYVRNNVGQKLSGRGIMDFFHVGDPVIVAYEGDRASVVRPPH
jgi:hypothetical protein